MADKGNPESAPPETTPKVEEPVTKPEKVPEKVEAHVVKPVDSAKSEALVKNPEEATTAPADTKTPEARAPEIKAPEVKTPDVKAKAPEEKTSTPDTKVPVSKAPEEKTPETKTDENAPKTNTPNVKAPPPEEKASAPETKVPEPEAPIEKTPDNKSDPPETKTPDVKASVPAGETPAIEEKNPPLDTEVPESKAPEEKAPDTESDKKSPESKTPDVKTSVPEEKTPDAKSDENAPKTKTPDVKAPDSKASKDKEDPETKAPETKSPNAKPEVKSPEKGSLTESIVNAVEGALVGAGAAAVKQIAAKSADDLKTIEDGLQKELVAETKHGLPSLSEIGEDIVDVVETVGEEIVEGAEIVIKEVKTHPELIAEGAVAVAVGVASIIQPELMVGSVAMIGKMAADRAKAKANEIAVEASTHVVNELSKDLNEELAEHAKLEATTTTTDTTKREKLVDEAAGTVTEKKTESSVKETTVVLTGDTQTVKPAEETTLATSIDGKDVKTIEPAAGEEGQTGPQTTSGLAKDVNPDATSPESVKEEATPESKNSAPDAGKQPSVVVKSTTKTVSAVIGKDGTITIGGADIPTESDSKIEPEELAKETPKEAEKTTDGAVSKKNESKSPTGASKSLEKKIDESIKEVKETVPVQMAATDAVPPNESEAPKAASSEPLTVPSIKTTPSTVATVVKPVETSAGDNGASSKVDFSAVQESIAKISQKLDTLTSPISSAKEIKEPQTPSVDTHAHESLAEIHQKLDNLIDSSSASIIQNGSTTHEDTSEKVTPEHLDKIHTKLDALLAKANDTSVASTESAEKHTISEMVSKIHVKLDEILPSIAKNMQASATKNDQDSNLAPPKDLKALHEKLDKMQESLSIKSRSDEEFVSVHEKMDKIYSAIFEKAKPVEEKTLSDETAKTIAQLHEKLEIMQSSIDKLTTALTAAIGGASEPAIRHPAALLTPEASGISEAVIKPDETPKGTLQPTFKFPAQASENAPAATNGVSSETPVTEPATTEPAVASSSAAKKNDTKKDDTKPIEDLTKPKDSPVKKHVKRSSVFGGWFG